MTTARRSTDHDDAKSAGAKKPPRRRRLQRSLGDSHAAKVRTLMSLCTEWQLVKLTAEEKRSRPLYCRSWNCHICRPKRKSQLLALAASGEPNRFLTLTVNPAVGANPEERLKMLSHAFNLLVKRLRRRPGAPSIQYLAVVEETKRGEPHLHILLRSDFIPWRLISNVMDELIHAPIVDIRVIKSQKEVVRYVAKYITKKPTQFGTSKRYWHSKDYELDKLVQEVAETTPQVRWTVSRYSLNDLLWMWDMPGWQTSATEDGRVLSRFIGGEYWQTAPPRHALSSGHVSP